MVYYTDETPGVNKRLVAGYYLFLCLIGFAILLGPTGSGIPITVINDRMGGSHELAYPFYGDPSDPESCIGVCHEHDAIIDYWNQTGHATAVTSNSTHVFIGTHATRTWAEFNASCARCHATNWNETSHTHDGLNVRCASCHDLSSPFYSVNGSNCASCHTYTEEHHNWMDDWGNSAHANSLTDLRGSSHAGSNCMHCMSGDGFMSYNGFFGDPAAVLDPLGPYNPITCPACHSVHNQTSLDNPAMLWADNSTELCGLCHSGDRYPMYDLFTTGPHGLTGIVECTNCHGWQQGAHGPVTNHTFYIINATATCGQGPECHEGQEAWAINQLEEIQSSFDALVTDLTTEASALETTVTDYNATAGADHDLVDYVLGVVDDASSTVSYYNGDRSHGFHNPMGAFDALNSAFRDVIDAKAYFYENMPEATPTTSTTTPVPTGGFDTLIVVGGAAGGIVVGLLLGVLVGRRR
ncbi:MAG: ammonia-forming cytochrome c nitrite reductase subunit c552 [Promethearchaeota archaeon]